MQPSQMYELKIACAGCKGVAYCSKDCQKADWTIHKPVCEFLQRAFDKNQHNVDIVHTQQMQRRLFLDFREAHSVLLDASAALAIEAVGGARNFDYSNRYLRIQLKMNLHSASNPSIAFRIADYTFADFTEFKDKDGVKSSRSMFVANDATYRALYPAYRGLLTVVFRLETLYMFQLFPIMSGPPDHHDSEIFLEQALSLINEGLVIRDVGGTKWFGRIHMEDNKWRWRKLPGVAGTLGSRGLSCVKRRSTSEEESGFVKLLDQ